MNIESFSRFQKIASLIFKVMMPLKLVRWILVLTMALWLGVALLRYVGDWGLLLPITTSITLLMAVMLLSLIPAQVIALASSRPLCLLGNSRHVLLIFLMIFAGVISGIFYGSLNINQPFSNSSVLFLVILLIISLLLQLSIWVYSRWPIAAAFIYVFFWPWMQIAVWLLTQSALLLILALLASWLVFVRWWLRWQPKKYQPNLTAAVMNHVQRLDAARNACVLFQSGKADTWLGSRLLGYSDGWRARQQGLLIAWLSLLLVFFVISWFEGKEGLGLRGEYILIPSMIFMSVAFSQAMAIIFVRNLRYVWLYCLTDRQGMFSLAWKSYVREVGAWMLLVVGFSLVMELVWGWWHGVDVWCYVIVSTLFMNVFVFYLVWWVYQQSKASLLWCNWICGVLVFLWALLLMATGLLFPLPFNWQGISIVWVWLPQIILIALLYMAVHKSFSSISFVRAV